MNADSSTAREGPGVAHDPGGRAPTIETITYCYGDEGWIPVAAWRVEHDPAQGIFRLAGPEGKTECFRDRPVRFLVVAPDPESGRMTPVIRDGRPSILNLCREERAAR